MISLLKREHTLDKERSAVYFISDQKRGTADLFLKSPPVLQDWRRFFSSGPD